jgi:cytochrome c biogenesis protein CcmG/thiol:disulfide interchange protein DsbE
MDPKLLPSALIDKPFPVFSLPTVESDIVSTSLDSVKGQPSLVNVWATWCVSCRVEHPFLNQLKAQGVNIIGINYKDDRNDAQAWLAEYADPYSLNIFDEKGKLGLDLGVYGAPETFFVDAYGTIKYKFVGVIGLENWRSHLAAIYHDLDTLSSTDSMPKKGAVQ